LIQAITHFYTVRLNRDQWIVTDHKILLTNVNSDKKLNILI